MIYKYEWRAQAYPVSAQDAAEELRTIEKKRGEVTAENVLDSSRPDGAVLHDCFEWDDSVAGEKWRLKQSSDLIGNIVRVSIPEAADEGEKKTETRFFVNARDRYEEGITTKGAFVTIDTALTDKEIYQNVLKNAIRELNSFRKKYSMLKELSAVFEEIEKIA